MNTPTSTTPDAGVWLAVFRKGRRWQLGRFCGPKRILLASGDSRRLKAARIAAGMLGEMTPAEVARVVSNGDLQRLLRT